MLTVYVLTKNLTGHMLDLYCVRLSKAAPCFENYTKLYFDAKHLEKEFNRGGERFWDPFFKKRTPFHKKYPFRPILNAALNL